MFSKLKPTLITGFLLLIFFTSNESYAQMEASPIGGNSMASSRESSIPVNNYTGIPSITLPLYSYTSQSGLSLKLLLNYFAGGVKAGDLPSIAGLGWNLSTGGVITRTIRGTADDVLGMGFLYTPSIEDNRPYTTQIAGSCLDAEQDLFQYNINGQSGSFYIGKNQKIVTDPGSHVRISVDLEPAPELVHIEDQVGGIRSFTLVTDAGVKYVFDNIEYQTSDINFCRSTRYKLTYGSAWYVSKVIAPYSADTIKFSYRNTLTYISKINPQTHSIDVYSNHSHSDSMGVRDSEIFSRIPTKIVFPDSTRVDFLYEMINGEHILRRIKISDTAFRYGYLFKFDTTIANQAERRLLTGINYYTAYNEQPGYTFTYNAPHLRKLDGFDFNDYKTEYQKDHWGYYNGLNTANRRNIVPSLAGVYTTGADRTVNGNAIAGSLASITDPSGGTTYYKFENNDVLPVTNTRQSYAVDASLNSSVPITLSRAHGNFTSFYLAFNYSFYRAGTPPVSGPGNLVFTITNTAGTVTYFTTEVNISHMYYNGGTYFGCTLPNGSYSMKLNLASGTTASSTLPVNISFFNQSATGGNSELAGGIRIKQITHYDPLFNKIDTLATYNYVTADGKSSGRGGQAPVYNHTAYFVSSTGTTVSATASHTNILSDPSDVYSFAEAGFVGYKRVEVIRGSLSHHLGKEVYEYSGAGEGFSNTDPAIFPFLPKLSADWAAGLPTRVLIYDSLNRLIKQTNNTYAVNYSTEAADSNFRSFKSTKISSNGVSGIGLQAVKYYTGAFYYPNLGISTLTAVADTFFHPDGSISASTQQMEYDSLFNLRKVTTDYDKTLNLKLDKYIYYTYNYSAGGANRLRADSIYIPVASETWISGDGNRRMIAGEATIYTNLNANTGPKVKAKMKPTATYVFESRKPIPENIIGAFTGSVQVRNSPYFVPRDSAIWNSDQSLVIQTVDKRTNFSSAILMGHNRKWPIAKVSNAQFKDIAYNSFESTDDGNWVLPSYTADLSNAITGNRSYPLSAGTISKSGLDPALSYYLSFWLKAGSSASSSAGTPTLTDTQNGWNFYTLTFTGRSSVNLSGIGWLDELRLHPKDASMVTTTYNALGQATSLIDANNTIVYNYYDSINRLKMVKDKDLRILKKYDYPPVPRINTAPVWIGGPAAFRCEQDENGRYTGRRTYSQRDDNYYSDSFREVRDVFYDYNYTICPVITDCGDPRYQFINGVCERACKEYISSLYKRVTDPTTGFQVYKWVCTWHYKWSDNSISENFTENHDESCYLGLDCVYE